MLSHLKIVFVQIIGNDWKRNARNWARKFWRKLEFEQLQIFKSRPGQCGALCTTGFELIEVRGEYLKLFVKQIENNSF